MLQSIINYILNSYKRKVTLFYQADLQLRHLQTNEVVWIGNKKIKKFIKINTLTIVLLPKIAPKI